MHNVLRPADLSFARNYPSRSRIRIRFLSPDSRKVTFISGKFSSGMPLPLAMSQHVTQTCITSPYAKILPAYRIEAIADTEESSSPIRTPRAKQNVRAFVCYFFFLGN
jgi:hypothetical protein